MVRLVEGQVYLKVNFLFLRDGVLRHVSGCWGGGEGLQSFRDVSGRSFSGLQGEPSQEAKVN